MMVPDGSATAATVPPTSTKAASRLLILTMTGSPRTRPHHSTGLMTEFGLPAATECGQDAAGGHGQAMIGISDRGHTRWPRIAVALAPLYAVPADAQDALKGKTIRLVVATPPGGGYDTYGRIVGRHLGEFLPGHPQITVVNMPGASGMNAVSWLYAQAPRDGSVIATFNKSQPFYQALGQHGVRFRSEDLSWIDNLSQAADLVSVWHTTGVRTIEDAKTRTIVMGSDSAGTMTLYPALLNATIGTRFKIVTGYPGSAADRKSVV